MKNRNFPIDFLRTLGLFAIILAHVSPPLFISQLRSFDVPLMVILSGFVFALTKKTDETEFKLNTYIKNRFIRLVVPVWVFLSFFFPLVFISAQILNIPFPFDGPKILSTYLLWEGIGFVWIIRIFLMMSLFGPLFIKKIDKFKNKLKTIFILYILYEISFFLYSKIFFHINDTMEEIIRKSIFYLIPYLLFFAYGVYFKKIKQKTLSYIIFLLTSLLIFGIEYNFLKYGTYPKFQHFKYPASSFYTVYALLISTLLLKNLDIFEKIKSYKFRKLIHFIGSYTLWIYLWHIPITLFLHFAGFDYVFTKYIIIISISVFIVFIQQKLLNFFLKRSVVLKNKEEALKTIFIG